MQKLQFVAGGSELVAWVHEDERVFGGGRFHTLAVYACMSAADRNNPIQVEIQRKNWLESYKYNLRDLDLMRGFYSVFGKAF